MGTRKGRKKPPPLRIMVSSTVYGAESFLHQLYATLTAYHYRVSMSHAGTVFANPKKATFAACIAEVERCDVFLGIVTGRYGSGRAADGLSITHLEMRKAIERKKLRWFLVHHDVLVARQLLKQFRFAEDGSKTDLELRPNDVLDNVRILDLYDEIVQTDVPLEERTGNWAQRYFTESEALRFVKAQFADPQRIRDLLNEDDV